MKYLKGYINRKAVQEIIQNNFYGLAIAELERLQDVVEYIEDYFENKDKGKEAVQEIMKNSFTGLTLAELNRLQKVVEYIKSYFEDKNEGKKVAQEIMKENFKGLSMLYLERLQKVVEHIESHFESKSKGKEVVQEIMQNNFTGLAIADPEKLKTIVEYIAKYTNTEDEKKIIIQQIIASINMFSRESDFEDESKKYFIFDKLNNLLKSIDKFIESIKYDKEQRALWKERLQNIFLNFSIEDLEKLHQDIKEEITCTAALS